MGIAASTFLPNGTGQGASEQPPSKEIYLPFIAQGYSPPAGWLALLNDYRAAAGLPVLSENAGWSLADWYHARYMVKNDVIAHSEDPANPWYTDAGNAAAQLSSLMISTIVATTDEDAIHTWMKAPFHAVGLIDPQLLSVGFGSFREADASASGFEMAAAIDTLSGLGDLPASVTYPVYWPPAGSSIPYARMVPEYPDPLVSCGYENPAGLPIILQIGAGNLSPQVTSHSLMQGGANLAHCIFTESTYSNPNSDDQELARAILGDRDAIVLIPRNPLTVGAEYTVSISTTQGSYTWSFTVIADE